MRLHSVVLLAFVLLFFSSASVECQLAGKIIKNTATFFGTTACVSGGVTGYCSLDSRCRTNGGRSGADTVRCRNAVMAQICCTNAFMPPDNLAAVAARAGLPVPPIPRRFQDQQAAARNNPSSAAGQSCSNNRGERGVCRLTSQCNTQNNFIRDGLCGRTTPEKCCVPRPQENQACNANGRSGVCKKISACDTSANTIFHNFCGGGNLVKCCVPTPGGSRPTAPPATPITNTHTDGNVNMNANTDASPPVPPEFQSDAGSSTPTNPPTGSNSDFTGDEETMSNNPYEGMPGAEDSGAPLTPSDEGFVPEQPAPTSSEFDPSVDEEQLSNNPYEGMPGVESYEEEASYNSAGDEYSEDQSNPSTFNRDVDLSGNRAYNLGRLLGAATK